ncbi:hypothetical protein [Nocardia sp. NPDC057440]|uniref:hypothetical protein n=1 Tax=Nocardia sp. NPDC057440 TaxID=3346134 RepID=UPI00366E0A92
MSGLVGEEISDCFRGEGSVDPGVELVLVRASLDPGACVVIGDDAATIQHPQQAVRDAFRVAFGVALDDAFGAPYLDAPSARRRWDVSERKNDRSMDISFLHGMRV